MADIDKGIPLQFSGGVNRDNTQFTMNVCVDAQWCRFWFQRPMKIGGYLNLTGNNFTSIARGIHVVSRNGINNYFVGTSNNLYNIPVSDAGVAAAEFDATPSGFISSQNNIWQFDDMFDVGSGNRIIFAHAGQNLANISNAINSAVYYGDPNALAPLQPVIFPSGVGVSGGVCCLHPYPIFYGNDGEIIWAAPGTVDFTPLGPGGAGSARITGSKIIKGASLRGGAGYSPAGLFWSLEDLSRIYYVGGQNTFANERIGKTRLLSSSAVVEDNGLFYWPTSDRRFCYYNGGINILPNNYNQLYFFKNLNWAQRQKVFGVNVGAFNEIWWFAPMFGATECNWVFIYNTKDQTWYDTPCTRSCGISAEVYPYPIMFDNTTNTGGAYPMWQHETGVDRVDGTQTLAIRSYFEPPIQTLVDKDKNVWTKMSWFEPDFVQTGNMTFQLFGENLIQGQQDFGTIYPMPAGTPKLTPQEQYRYLQMHIESNEAGGFYYMGKPMMKLEEGNRTVGNT